MSGALGEAEYTKRAGKLSRGRGFAKKPHAEAFRENSLNDEAHSEPRINLGEDQAKEQGESLTCNMLEVFAWPEDKEVNPAESAFTVLEGELGVIEATLIPIREQFSFQVGMVFFISEKYALPPNITCNAVDILDTRNNVCDISPPCCSKMGPVLAKSVTAPPLEATSSVARMPTLTFSTPTLDMATHMRPLYISVEVEGITINQIMVDTGATVNVVTTRTMGLLGIPCSMIQITSLTIKNFTRQVSRTLGLFFLRVKVGPLLE
ncbi:hypothetical protein ACLB2K_040521 [Fragaria x ananassa]